MLNRVLQQNNAMLFNIFFPLNIWLYPGYGQLQSFSEFL